MLQNIKELDIRFEKIKRLGWVKEINHGYSSIGLTFEQLMGKEIDNFPIPDFFGIEVKTMNDYALENLHLFNLTPDGDYLFPIKRLLEILGCPDKNNKEMKIFYRSFNSKYFTEIGKFKEGKIFVNYQQQKVDLIVYNDKKQNININVSWSFNWLKERLMLKLQYLAIVRAFSRITNNEGYYYYHKINFYRLKDFDIFIKLIEEGIISITFKIGFYKSGRRKGQIYDHGTDFSIDIKDIHYLYDEIKI